MRQNALNAGAKDGICCDHWAKGGLGAKALAESVVKLCAEVEQPELKYLYDVYSSIHDKIEIIATEMYGADGIELSDLAKKKIEYYTAQVRETHSDIIKGIFKSTNLYGKDSFKFFS